ncbi:subtilisin-like protease SBT5.3 [Magnolia sinica]|uniref:subtilisin-like protease SBT5.3 n=1 Tax=Magnolia sinica TaxID=86752 RepID=UPI002659ECCD|nr:subtilisin-like protease SBT5.3 [Magnolia sinica]
MGIARNSIWFFWVLLSFSLLQTPTLAIKKSYIVYLGGHSHGLDLTTDDYEKVTVSHYNLLGSFLGSREKAQEAIFYSYKVSINGFAANLEEEEAIAISKHPDVVSVFLNKERKLHTTRSWHFLGLERDGRVPPESLWQRARFGEDTIIGNIDTGVWPESESFNDEGMGPIPSKWKGICQNDTNDGFKCNRKLIGARYFNQGLEAIKGGPLNSSIFYTVRDSEGHGTHTLSTAGGGFVAGANIFGYANGTAKGGSPKARVAAYKVCWPGVGGCYEADIMAAFDAAIHDGVDVLSVSLGGDALPYFEDGTAIAAFHAVMNGITVVCSAGNSGPQQWTASNIAPWILTVGASTIDREFPSYAKLGNNKQYKGQSLSSDYLQEKFYPLITSSDAKAANASDETSQLCMVGDLDPEKVKGKIVICLRGGNARVEKGQAVHQAGGVGMILANDEESGNEIISDAHFLPATHITYTDGVQVYSYINSTKSPVAYITPPKTDLGTKPAPFMAAFSSQGPNAVTTEILKPDITAPGVSVLAAYSQATSPTGIDLDHRRVPFNVESGTSMSCPHIAGVVGLLKTLHPDWSPSAIRSAIMTTARSRDNTIEPIKDSFLVKATPLSYGAGHVRPNRAMDPGLIYDLTVDDYLNFLCTLSYDSTLISSFANYSCPSKNISLLNLNYPSITHPLLTSPTTITRTVRNVGPPSTYTVRVDPPAGVFVTVEPKILKFEKTGEEKTFKVTLTLKHGKISDYSFGRLIWSDGVHYVRSPISVSSTSSSYW